LSLTKATEENTAGNDHPDFTVDLTQYSIFFRKIKRFSNWMYRYEESFFDDSDSDDDEPYMQLGKVVSLS
jgi:hypothetical protein